MEQLSFLDDPNKLARKTDPQTSKTAALKTTSFVASHEGKIWMALEIAKDFGITQRDVEGLSPVQANRRFAAMSERKLIKRNGEKRNGCCVWIKA